MKSIVGLCSVALMAASFAAFAERVVITGTPVTLEARDNVYYFPETYVMPTDTTVSYHYVSVGGLQQVCYAEKQAEFVDLQPNMVKVKVKPSDEAADWYCYPADNKTYFEITQ